MSKIYQTLSVLCFVIAMLSITPSAIAADGTCKKIEGGGCDEVTCNGTCVANIQGVCFCK